MNPQQQPEQPETPSLPESPQIPQAAPQADQPTTEMSPANPTLSATEPDEQHIEHEAISWEASESVHHEKDMLWYAGIIAGGLLLSTLSLFVLKSYTFTFLIAVMVVALIVLAKRPPRVLHYELHDGGITIDQKHYSIHEFKAFGVVHDGPFYYISLLPVKRFMPSIDIYFPEEYGEEIVDILGEQIPLQTIKSDWLDRVTKQLRF